MLCSLSTGQEDAEKSFRPEGNKLNVQLPSSRLHFSRSQIRSTSALPHPFLPRPIHTPHPPTHPKNDPGLECGSSCARDRPAVRPPNFLFGLLYVFPSTSRIYPVTRGPRLCSSSSSSFFQLIIPSVYG